MRNDVPVRQIPPAMSVTPRILSLSSVFPRPGEPRFGLFVARRLEHLARLAAVEAVAPVPWVEMPGARLHIPRLEGHDTVTRGDLTVHYRRWLYPPGLGIWHPAWMAAQLLPFLRRLRRRFAFDVIDAHFGYPEGAAALRLARRLSVPFTVTLRGNELIHSRSPRRRAQMAEAFRHAAAVIAVSSELRGLAVSLGADPERAVVIGNGVDTGVFHPRPREEARQRLSMDPSRLHILSAGWLVMEKGHHRIAALLPRLHAAGLQADVWIVGAPGRGDDARPEIARIVSAHGLQQHVHLPGQVAPETLAEYMSACDVFCLASSREGWPNVVQEALACGAPVVATRVGAVSDLVSSEEFGLVVAPDDDEALLAALDRALRNRFDRERIARQGGSRSWAQVAAETFQVLCSAVRQRQPRTGEAHSP